TDGPAAFQLPDPDADNDDVPDGDPVTNPKPGQKYLWLSGNLETTVLNDEVGRTADILAKLTG
ncbi:MAG: hypothetical protein AAB289_13235, partial [Chloroflexota bacterium]